MSRLWIPIAVLSIACTPSPEVQPAVGLDPPTDTSISPADTATGPDSTPQTLFDVRIEASGPITCAEPEARNEQVYDVHHVGEDWLFQPNFRTEQWNMAIGARGVIVAELNGDGIDDMVVPRDMFPTQVLWGVGDGTFVDATSTALPGPLTRQLGGAAADWDADGDLDVILHGVQLAPRLLINDGSGGFTVEVRTDWTEPAAQFGCGGAASFADYDRDGILDLMYGRLGFMNWATDTLADCDSYLLKGVGGGEFVDDSAQLSPDVQASRIFQSGWHDLDDDGWLDLYTVSDCIPVGYPNRVMLNDQGTLGQAEGTGLDVYLAGMGLAAGDLNSDGRPDLMVPGIDEYSLLLSQPDLGDVWIDVATSLSLHPDLTRHQRSAWGGEFVDLDNDMRQDMVVTFGRFAGSQTGLYQPDEIYRNVGGPLVPDFVQVGQEWGFDDDNVMRGFAVADLNDDGWMDIIKRELGGVVIVHTARCGDAGWLVVRLHDTLAENPDAIGAKVTVVHGDQRQTRTVSAGSTSYVSSGPPEVHFGLGSLETVDAIEIRWPTGETTVLPSQQTRQILEITRE